MKVSCWLRNMHGEHAGLFGQLVSHQYRRVAATKGCPANYLEKMHIPLGFVIQRMSFVTLTSGDPGYRLYEF